jgi:leader peptidase (prepilin peptidase)/N-methyltransferase
MLGGRQGVLALLAAGPFAAMPLFFLWAISRGKWMGFGDVKLALGMGWLLGPAPGIFAVFLGFVIGTIILVPLVYGARLVTHMRGYGSGARGLTMKSEVPFGPFLIMGTFLVWISLLYGYNIVELIGW